MLPVLRFGLWQIRTYILGYVVATLVVDALSVQRLRRAGWPQLAALRAVLVTTTLGFAGAYLIRVLPTFQRFLAAGIWEWYGGNSFIGGLLGGIGTLAAACWLGRQSISRALDAVLPPLALGQAIGRLGCFAAGCCYGRPTTSWLGMYLPDHAGNWALRYPTQLLSAAANLLIFGALLAVERWLKPRREGTLAALYLGLYCLERFGSEALRADAVPLFHTAGLALSWVQFYTLAGLGLSLGWLIWQLSHSGTARA